MDERVRERERDGGANGLSSESHLQSHVTSTQEKKLDWKRNKMISIPF